MEDELLGRQSATEEARSVEKSLKFRQAVLEEFERLVREGVPVADLPGVDEPGFDAPEETYAVA